MTPGKGHFLPQGHNLNKLCRGPLGGATYQASMPCGFRQEDFFHVFPIYANVKYLTPGAGPFLAPGA